MSSVQEPVEEGTKDRVRGGLVTSVLDSVLVLDAGERVVEWSAAAERLFVIGRGEAIGHDLVGMVVDDIVVVGATPLFLTDYIACGRVVPERIAEIVAGVADGCRRTGTALVGGETAEHPDLLAPDEYDLAGAAVGAVEADALLGPQRVHEGDAVAV